jgi:5-methylthioadenosine/S-adenosylhomocysteine deaminase
MENRKEKIGVGRGRIFYFLISIFICCSALQGQTARDKERVDLLVMGGTVVTMDGARHVYEDGAVAVRGDTIVAVGPRTEIEGKYTATRRIDARGKLILPGLINGHTHAPMTLLRGIANDVNLQDWLTKYIFPAEARNVNEEFVVWGTRLALLEMVRGGTTTFADMYYYEDAIARETKAAGMRGVLGETMIDFPVPGYKTVSEGLAYTEEFLKHWKGDPLIHAAVAPHSIYTASEKTLRDSFALARKYNAPVLIHLSETKKELEDSGAKHGATPVAYLEQLGLLGPDTLAAHCIWLDAADMVLLAKRGVGCVHNPSSNMMLASGIAAVIEMRAAGVRLGLGTDGPSGSNNDLDMMEEMDLAAKLQKIARVNPAALTAEQALEMATIEGARALHMEKEIGSLEAGKKVDLIVLNLSAPNAVPLYDLYAQIVYALKASDVETVVIGGRTVMENRRVLTLDEPSIIAKARAYGEEVKKSLAAPGK